MSKKNRTSKYSTQMRLSCNFKFREIGMIDDRQIYAVPYHLPRHKSLLLDIEIVKH